MATKIIIKRTRGRPKKESEEWLRSNATEFIIDFIEKSISPANMIDNEEQAEEFAEFVRKRKETGIDYSKDLMVHEIDRWPLK